MSTTDLTAKLREIKEFQRIIDEATAEMESLKDDVKAEMTARNTSEIIVDIFKVRYTTVLTNRFDSTAFKITHKELYEQYTKASESKRFTIA